VVGTALPLSCAIKSLLRWTFGSIQNHNWLATAPDHFHGLAAGEDDNGIPSSHMLVLTHHSSPAGPTFRATERKSALIWGRLTAALMATKYQFLSDVLAGTGQAWWCIGRPTPHCPDGKTPMNPAPSSAYIKLQPIQTNRHPQ
jgi:hypothetical protein